MDGIGRKRGKDVKKVLRNYDQNLHFILVHESFPFWRAGNAFRTRSRVVSKSDINVGHAFLVASRGADSSSWKYGWAYRFKSEYGRGTEADF